MEIHPLFGNLPITAVGVLAVGNKVLKDRDTISVENLVFQFYTEPETDNPVTDTPDFTIPPTGTFPPVREYRIK